MAFGSRRSKLPARPATTVAPTRAGEPNPREPGPPDAGPAGDINPRAGKSRIVTAKSMTTKTITARIGTKAAPLPAAGPVRIAAPPAKPAAATKSAPVAKPGPAVARPVTNGAARADAQRPTGMPRIEKTIKPSTGLFDSLRRSSEDLLHPIEALKRVTLVPGAPRQPPADPVKQLFDTPAETALSLARELYQEYTQTREISFTIVYRLELAYATLNRNMEESGVSYGPRRARLREALLQVVHLSQVARGWQQDIYNLKTSLYYDQIDARQRIDLEQGITRLQQFVQTNITDFAKWLRAADTLSRD